MHSYLKCLRDRSKLCWHTICVSCSSTTTSQTTVFFEMAERHSIKGQAVNKMAWDKPNKTKDLISETGYTKPKINHSASTQSFRWPLTDNPRFHRAWETWSSLHSPLPPPAAAVPRAKATLKVSQRIQHLSGPESLYRSQSASRYPKARELQ